jgi:hypothetical protein
VDAQGLVSHGSNLFQSQNSIPAGLPHGSARTPM